MVGLGGLEPPTSHLSGAHSNQLSYRPILNLLSFSLFKCISKIVKYLNLFKKLYQFILQT